MTSTEVNDAVDIRAAQFRIVLERARPRILSYTEAQAPIEAVGLISNEGTLYPLINQRRSTSEFMVSKTFLEEGFAWLEKKNQIPVALYHSHPTKTSYPSPADINAMSSIPGTVYVIHGVDDRRIAAWIWENNELVKIVEVEDV